MGGEGDAGLDGDRGGVRGEGAEERGGGGCGGGERAEESGGAAE